MRRRFFFKETSQTKKKIVKFVIIHIQLFRYFKKRNSKKFCQFFTSKYFVLDGYHLVLYLDSGEHCQILTLNTDLPHHSQDEPCAASPLAVMGLVYYDLVLSEWVSVVASSANLIAPALTYDSPLCRKRFASMPLILLTNLLKNYPLTRTHDHLSYLLILLLDDWKGTGY